VRCATLGSGQQQSWAWFYLAARLLDSWSRQESGRSSVVYTVAASGAGGQIGAVVFLLLLGAAIYALYFQIYIHGIESLLPTEWRNGK
jgi:hypothetical protein